MEGILEIRGISKRIIHYKGFLNNKRIYEKHALGINNGEIGNKTVGINNSVLRSICQS